LLVLAGDCSDQEPEAHSSDNEVPVSSSTRSYRARVVRDDQSPTPVVPFGRRHSAQAASAANQPGTGSTSTPLIVRRPSSAPGVPMSRAPMVAGITVLFVDDESVNRQVARRMLQKLGCTVHVLSVSPSGSGWYRVALPGPSSQQSLQCCGHLCQPQLELELNLKLSFASTARRAQLEVVMVSSPSDTFAGWKSGPTCLGRWTQCGCLAVGHPNEGGEWRRGVQ
jgi:hypothetical protein